MEEQARVTRVGNVVVIHSPYNTSLIAEIKAFPGRKWSADLKMWSVPNQYEEHVRAVIRKYFPLEDELNIEEGVPDPATLEGPFAVLRLEFIGENFHAYKRSAKVQHEPTERYKDYLGRNQSRPWVKRITGYGPRGGLVGEYVNGQIDYSQANSVGSRGVYIYFPLLPGVYEVNERTSWKSVRKYFCQVEGEQITEISREVVEQWLSSRD